jgi:hypothetical protein
VGSSLSRTAARGSKLLRGGLVGFGRWRASWSKLHAKLSAAVARPIAPKAMALSFWSYRGNLGGKKQNKPILTPGVGDWQIGFPRAMPQLPL